MSWGGHSKIFSGPSLSAPSRLSREEGMIHSGDRPPKHEGHMTLVSQASLDTPQLRPSPLHLCPRKPVNEDMCCGAAGWAWWGPLQGQLAREDYPLDPEA